MKVFVLIACLIVAISAKQNDYAQWLEFKDTHSRQYESIEDKIRFQVFQENLREIEEHNARYAKGEVKWYKGITQFADWTKDEFQALLTRQAAARPKLDESLGVYVADPNENLPSYVNWQTAGAVLPVRNQGNCGACWAFSTVGALEGQVAIQKKEKIPLSPQYLVDCSTENSQCAGGEQSWALDYVVSNGISSESDYPYAGVNQTCNNDAPKFIASIAGYKQLNATEQDLISAIANVGPISVSADATLWMFYAGGVFDWLDCGNNLNHAVLATGYNDEFISLKNSWGLRWGEQGYIRIQRRHNICGINEQNYYPIL